MKNNIKELSLVRTALPYFAQVLVGTVAAPINTFISSGINEFSMEAVGTASSLLFMFGILATLLSGGSSIIIGHFIGNDSSEKEMKKAVDTSFWINAIQGFFLAALMLIIGRYLLNSWGVETGSKAYEIGVHYINVLAPMFFVSSLIGYFIQTVAVFGRPKLSMIVGIIASVMDASLSAIFVYCTDLGVDAVIYGTLIARFTALVISVVGYHMWVQHIWKIRGMNWFFTKKIMRISIPIAGEKINYNSSRFVQGMIIGNIAATIGLVIAGHNVMLQQRSIFTAIQSVVLVGSVAISIALEPIVSRLLGKKNYTEAKKIVTKAWWIGMAFDIPAALLVFAISPYIVDLMASQQKDQAVIDELKSGLRWAFGILVILEVGRVSNLVYIAATRSAGDAKYTAIVSMIVTWFSLLIAWLLARYAGLGYAGIIIGSAFDECARGLVNWLRWKSNKWKKHIDKVHEKEEETVKTTKA